MQANPTEIEGVFVLRPRIARDARGSFVKTYNHGLFRELGLDFVPVEEYFTVSVRDVVRGMHFQLPPAAHDKCVYCPAGAVLDVVLDLRKQSPTYGRHLTRELNSENREGLYIPVGCAHGFAALSAEATMFYQTSTTHAPAQDAGVRWDSFGWHWPVEHPILSERDTRLPSLDEFASPF